MSTLALLHTERRWQRYVLVPLNFVFLFGAYLSFRKGALWYGAAFGILMLYVGWVGAKLQIHWGERFDQLSQGITPKLAEAPKLPEEEALSDLEMYSISATMIRTNYAIAGSVVVFCLALGVKYYWALLLGLAAWLIGQPLGAITVALLSSPSSIRQRFRRNESEKR